MPRESLAVSICRIRLGTHVLWARETFAAWLALALATTALAQQPASNDELAAQATDPTAALMSFQLNDWFTARFHGLDDSSNQVVFRAAIPFGLGGLQHASRVTEPYVASSTSAGSGVADTTIFDLAVFDQPLGRWGAGFSGTLPTGKDGLSLDKWTAGPAAGFVNSSTRQSNWGLFAQTFFSLAGEDSAADVGLVNVQPIFSYQLGAGRSLSLGNSALVYNTEKSRVTSMKLGVNYGQVAGMWGHKWRPSAEFDYDFEDDFGNPQWIFRLGIALLIPTHR